ncbi:MAG TPA: EI24 domain-containing protein [Saprospiraceae bacterium]|nr:EI24 domain-containing protein [Saprospiraceae bacterium]HMQ84848.1 EI24 domain-containing protein [Saprospiraceae bacterium]
MFNEISDGISSHLKALSLISKHRLWIYCLAPGIISLLLGVAIIGTAWNISDNAADWLMAFYPYEWGRKVLDWIAQAFSGLLVLTLGFLLFRHIVMAISAPLMSFLSEKVEKILKGDGGAPPFSLPQILSDLVRGITISLRNIIRELFFTFLIFLLGVFIPFLAPIVPVLIFLVQAFYAGFGNMDFCLERHFRVRDSVRFVRRYKGLAIGNGTVFLLLLFTGIGFLVALPLGTVAATVESVKRVSSF